MSQKEQLAKLASRLIQDPDYTFSEAVDAAFLMGARAMQESIISDVKIGTVVSVSKVRAKKPEELL